MKKSIKIIIAITILLLVIFGVIRVFYGPRVSIKEKMELKKYAVNYLNQKYGNHKYKVNHIRYEYDKDSLFDYSNPTGYWIDFTSDIVSDSWIIINGLIPNDYNVDHDYFIESYYFPEQDGYDIHKVMDNMKPKKELETNLLNELQKEFEPNVIEVNCNTIILDIPKDYGKIPTLNELQNDTNLYEVTSFEYKVSNSIENINEYANNLKSYFQNKYSCNLSVYFLKENTLISVFLDI